MSTNLVGATVNAGGTKIALAKAHGTAVLNTADASKDFSTAIPHGSGTVSVKEAIAMGILQRNAAGVLVELNPAQAYTRVG